MRFLSRWTVLLALLVGDAVNAGILGQHQIEIDLTNPEDTRAKATWEPDGISVTKDGLGWDGANNSSRDFWLMTKPLGIGTTWRPTNSASIRVTVSPEARSYKSANGQRGHENVGSVYVRYSPDQKHWSSWQAVGFSREAHAKARENADANKGFVPYQRSFSTSIAIPQMARRQYSTLLDTYRRSDVPWASDEEALVKKIMADDPKFFEKELPFVGYVQFLYETSISGGLRLREFKADIGWAVSGLHSPAKDPAAEKDRNGAWRFVHQ